MWKIIGIILFGAGLMGEVYEWIAKNKSREKRLEEMSFFLKKARYAMEEEKVRWIPFFKNYKSKDTVVTQTLHNIAQCLEEHRYPYGEDAWKAVFLEKKREWNCKEACFQMLMQMGNAFFGRSRQENADFMERYSNQLEEWIKKEKEQFTEERKVWIPVSLLGGVMIVIMLV